MRNRFLLCLSIILVVLLVGVSAFGAAKTKATLLAEVDFIELESTKYFFGVSDDNRSVFYEDHDDGKYIIFVNSKKLTNNDIVGWQYPLSPDGKRTAVICTNDEGQGIAEVDGKKVILDGSISIVTFSPDSRNAAYTFYKEGKAGVSLDGKETKLYEMTSRPYFMKGSAGNRLVYTAKSDGKWFLVIDGKERKKYDGIREVVVSPDGNRLAIEALEGGKGFVVVDGKEGKRYEDINQDDNTLVFSPDSKHLAYIAGKRGSEFVVLDDAEQKSYKYIIPGDRTLIFSPDSKHLAYIAATNDDKFAIILDGKQHRIYENISTNDPPVFSTDGRLAYAAKAGENGECIVLNGKEQTIYDQVGSPVFSADSKHFAYRATKDEKNFVVLDGKEQKKYNQISLLVLSPDGKHHAYVARDGEDYDEQFVVIDGIECKDDGFIIPDRSDRLKIIFDNPTKLHFIAQKDKKVYLVEKELE